jgi:hypothetical protein
MFCAPGPIFGCTEGVRSRFNVLRVLTRFQRYRGHRVPFFKFCASELVFGGTAGIGYRFHVSHSRTHVRWYRGRRLPFSSFARPDSLSTVPRASGPVFMFSAPRLIFDGTEGVRTHFHILRSRTYFWRCRVRRVTFSCVARSDSFSTVPRATGPIFMFCAQGLIFGSTEGGRSRFNVLHARTHLPRYRRHWVPFSSFALPDSFLAVLRASGPVFMFCATVFVFGGTEGVGSLFLVLCSRTRFLRYRGRRLSFSCFARPDSFSAYRGRLVPFSCFALPDMFSVVSSASGHIFMFCVPGIFFGGPEGDGSHFHVLRVGTSFRWYRGRLASISYFALLDTFSAVRRASGPVFMNCAPGLIFGDPEGVGFHFHVLRVQTRFRRYRGRRLPFSCFVLPDSFSTVSRASGPVFLFSAVPRVFGPVLMLCAPGLISRGTEDIKSRFQVLRYRTRFWRYRGHRAPFSCFALPDSFLAMPRASSPVFMFCAP